MKTIKKITTGVFALIFGLGLLFTQSAFKSSSKNETIFKAPVTLYYHGPSYSKAEVEIESNWTTVANEPACDDVQEAACRIIVDESAIDYSAPSPQLKSDANLTADFNTPTASAYVTGSNYNMTILNRSN